MLHYILLLPVDFESYISSLKPQFQFKISTAVLFLFVELISRKCGFSSDCIGYIYFYLLFIGEKRNKNLILKTFRNFRIEITQIPYSLKYRDYNKLGFSIYSKYT